VIFTSDNGPWLNREIDGGSPGHLTDGKFTVWEGGPRVPTIARWPGEIPGGSVCSELVTAMDLLPTLANLAGTGPPADRVIDGEDVGDLLSNPETGESPHDYYLYQTSGGELNAIRDAEGWKLHRDTGELYDRHTDAEEEYDVADETPETVQRLRDAAEIREADIAEHARPVGRIE